jgi:formate dehydrogenase subunit gamma
MGNRTVERFRKRTIALHWVHTAAFLILVATGGVLFLKGSGYSSFYSLQILHRIAAGIFIAIPVVNYFLEPKRTAAFIKETFKWGRDDIKWAEAASNYYFGGNEDRMPPQGHINAGQKIWQAVVIVTGVIFVITGTVMWGFRLDIPVSVYQWILFVHGLAFVVVFAMLLLHIYLGVFHPRFRESLQSMIDGKISPTYARTHYPKWYNKI